MTPDEEKTVMLVDALRRAIALQDEAAKSKAIADDRVQSCRAELDAHVRGFGGTKK